MIAVAVVVLLTAVAVAIGRWAFSSPVEDPLVGPSSFGEWSVDDEVRDAA